MTNDEEEDYQDDERGEGEYQERDDDKDEDVEEDDEDNKGGKGEYEEGDDHEEDKEVEDGQWEHNELEVDLLEWQDPNGEVDDRENEGLNVDNGEVDDRMGDDNGRNEEEVAQADE